MPGEKPKLVVGITLSQFRSDFITRYWDKLDENGLKKLVMRGTECKNVKISHAGIDHGVGLATIVTGANPNIHGIVGEGWYSSIHDEVLSIIADEKTSTVGGPFEAGRCSPHQLFVTTYADELKLATGFAAKVYSISMEPSSAIFGGGHTANAAYWFDYENGNFITSSYYRDSLPAWVNTFNAKRFADTYIKNEWSTLLPIDDYNESLSDTSRYETGIHKQINFPYSLEKLSKKVDRKNPFRILNYSPFGSTLTKDFAIQLIENDSLGKDDITDVLNISYTAFENIGRLFGPLSVEMEDLVLRFDKELAHFFNYLEAAIGMENVLVVLTAEQGVLYPPQYLNEHRIPSGVFSINSAMSLLQVYMNNKYGKGDWVRYFDDNQIYLNRLLIEDAQLKLEDVQEEVAQFLLQFEGVTNTVTATSLQKTDFSGGAFATLQNTYNQKRSGDVIIQLRQGWAAKTGDNVHSLSVDSRVPLLWYGWKTKRTTIFEPVDLIDIAPTISHLLNINTPNGATGIPVSSIIR